MKLIKLFFVMCILCVFTLPIKANENEYILVNEKNETIDKYNSYDEVLNAFNDNFDKYDNISIIKNGHYLKTKYGIVELKVAEGCTYNVKYKDDFNNEGILNGCYGIDAGYVKTSDDLSKITILIGGLKASIDFEDAKIIPIDKLDVRTSLYSVVNDNLYHQVKTQLQSDHYTTVINLGRSPSYLENDKNYYSYDGNYFYDSFYKLIDDNRNGEHNNAINSNNPYFNYYQYLPHRSISEYNSKEIDSYIKNNLGMIGKLYQYRDYDFDKNNDIVNHSQYYDEAIEFVGNQYIYGANALMMLSLSINESDYGRNLTSFLNNNLYMHAAYEKDEELKNNRYQNVSDSIYSHAKYFVSNKYCNSDDASYAGSFFGNKKSGINAKLSADPYWGEKLASTYYKVDNALGNKDLNKYCLGIINDASDFKIYNSKELITPIMHISNVGNYSLIILSEEENVYKVQIDLSLFNDYHYDFETGLGYVKKEAINKLINQEMLKEPEYKYVSFYAGDGMFINGNSSIGFNIPKDKQAEMIKPSHYGYEFNGFKLDEKNEEISEKYDAQYLLINDFDAIKEDLNTKYLTNYPNLTNDKVLVKYEDGSEKEVFINTNMLTSMSGKDNKTNINYFGVTKEYTLDVDNNYLDKNISLKNSIKQYEENKDINLLLAIKKQINEGINHLTADEIRLIDNALFEYVDNRVNYHIKQTKKNLNISGMVIGLPLNKLDDETFIINNTYDAKEEDISLNNYNYLKAYADEFDYEIIDSFTVKFYYNYDELKTNAPMIFSITPKNMDDNLVYLVLKKEEDGDIVKINTIRSKNYLTFLSEDVNEFLIVGKKTSNEYNFDDQLEILNKHTMNYNQMTMFLGGLLIVAIISLLGIMLIGQKKKGELWKDYKK